VTNIDALDQYSDITLSQEPFNIKVFCHFKAIFFFFTYLFIKRKNPLPKGEDCGKIFYFLLRGIIRIGVPSNSNDRRIWFSKNREYEKCIKFSSFTKMTKVGGFTATCVA